MKQTPASGVNGGATRRDFLKTAAAATAASSAAFIARNAYAAGSDVLRVGMIGCGPRCTGAAAEALTADPGARVVAMTDMIPGRIQAKPIGRASCRERG